MTDEEGRRRLAELMQQHRQRLGLSVNEAVNRSGGAISRPTWTNAESSLRIRDTGYAPIERVLGWMPGSVRRILAGGEPTLATMADGTDAYPLLDALSVPADWPLRRAQTSSMPAALAEEIERVARMHHLPVEERMRIVRTMVELNEEAARQHAERPS